MAKPSSNDTKNNQNYDQGQYSNMDQQAQSPQNHIQYQQQQQQINTNQNDDGKTTNQSPNNMNNMQQNSGSNDNQNNPQQQQMIMNQNIDQQQYGHAAYDPSSECIIGLLGNHGMWMSHAQDGAIQCNAVHCGDSEIFESIPINKKVVAIKSSRNRYVTCPVILCVLYCL